MTILQFRASRTTATQRQSSGSSSIERAGRPLNLIGFIYPSNAPRGSRQLALEVSLFLLSITSVAVIVIGFHLFR